MENYKCFVGKMKLSISFRAFPKIILQLSGNHRIRTKSLQLRFHRKLEKFPQIEAGFVPLL